MVNYLLCVDGSNSSHRALDHLVKITKPADIVWIYSCYTPPTSVPDVFDIDESLMIHTTTSKDDFIRDAIDQSKKYCQDVLMQFQKKMENSHCNTVIEQVDDVREGIISFAQKQSIETIVIGTRGLGTIKRLLLGSVSTYVVQHAPCPVLVVP